MGVHLEDMDSLFGDKSVYSGSIHGPGGNGSIYSQDTQSLLGPGNSSFHAGTVNSNTNLLGSPVLQPSAAALARTQRSQSNASAPGSGGGVFSGVSSPKLNGGGGLSFAANAAMAAANNAVAAVAATKNYGSSGNTTRQLYDEEENDVGGVCDTTDDEINANLHIAAPSAATPLSLSGQLQQQSSQEASTVSSLLAGHNGDRKKS
ncbi:hypothetical protein D0Z03_001263 [Geotrichum reessii]|nr:hypothetical protein D0Z03_001263 [Galactomyces reessii]